MLLAIGVLALGRYFAFHSREVSCGPFNEIVKNVELNKEFRFELNEFANHEMVRKKILGRPHRGHITISPSFSERPPGWLSLLENYPTHQRLAVFVVRFDGQGVGTVTPPYKIAEVGVYSRRSIIMYKNLNDEWYHNGPGLVDLSAEPYIICGSAYDETSISFQNK